MTSFEVERVQLTTEAIATWGRISAKHSNWPVVYALEGSKQVYVGESINVMMRLKQHVESPDKSGLTTARVVLDPTFNKSVCLDLESYLIRLLAGDGRYEVINRNAGITDAEYYDRSAYRQVFDEVFEELRAAGMFTRSVPEIENSDLFKLSPFKALTSDQAIAVEDIVEGLFEDLELGRGDQIVVQGDPGTGKTIVAVYLAKLLVDIRDAEPGVEVIEDSLFSDFFTTGHAELLHEFKIGFVVPQQALRKSIQRVFDRTPGLSSDMVLSPFQVVDRPDFDLLIVDEAHRLSQRAAQGSGPLNGKFIANNVELFGRDDLSFTQLDWIREKSRHQILLMDAEQTVKTADLPVEMTRQLIADAVDSGRMYRLTAQHRVKAGQDYVAHVRSMLSNNLPPRRDFGDYEFRIFDDLREMRALIRDRERQFGLSRLIAGYAWPWRSKRDPEAFDIHIDGERMRWNTKVTDWVSSPRSAEEVGSIHTIQGYDLNYAGVIIGRDLQYDTVADRLVFSRPDYFDGGAMKNNNQRGISYSDDDLLAYVRNIYCVLLTRGILGTYVYVVDDGLRERLRECI